MSYNHPAGLPFVDAKTPAVLVPAGPVTRDEVAGLCEDVRVLLDATGAGVVVCDVAGIGPTGLWAPSTCWPGCSSRPDGPGAGYDCGTPARRCARYCDLVGLALEVEGQVEEGEPAGGVQEAVESGDPAL